MKYKVWVLYLAFTPLWVYPQQNDSISVFTQQILVIEEAIAMAEIESSLCRTSETWRFPGKIYAYVDNAKFYSKKTKPKYIKKYFQCLVLIQLCIDEALEGKPGYWSGNSEDVWVDPVLPVPVCAQTVFKGLQTDIETLLSTNEE